MMEWKVTKFPNHVNQASYTFQYLLDSILRHLEPSAILQYLAMVEQFASSHGLQHLVIGVVDDVVGANGRKRLSSDAEGASFEFDDIFLEDDVTSGGNSTTKAYLV